MKYFIGFDVGKNGGIAIMDENKNITLKATPKVGDQIDVRQIAEMVGSLDGDVHCVIEDVHSIFGVGAASNFQFGRALGILEGIVTTYQFPFTKITPKVWQKEMWQGIKPVEINTGKKTKNGEIKYKIDTKATSLIACKRLFPKVDLRGEVNVEYYADNAANRKLKRVGLQIPSKKKDHDGIVDALLMAEYCRRKLC